MQATARCALLQADATLEPAGVPQMKGELAACLALVGSVGMTDAARALLVRDQITTEQFDVLTAPMRAAGIDFDVLREADRD